MKEYTCEMCGGSFVSHRPDTDAEAEYSQDFGDHDCPRAIICDVCYKTLKAEELP